MILRGFERFLEVLSETLSEADFPQRLSVLLALFVLPLELLPKLIAICLNHFVLIEVCSVDILVACLSISAGLKRDSFRETRL